MVVVGTPGGGGGGGGAKIQISRAGEGKTEYFILYFFNFFSMTILQNAWIQQIASIASYMMYPD